VFYNSRKRVPRLQNIGTVATLYYLHFCSQRFNLLSGSICSLYVGTGFSGSESFQHQASDNNGTKSNGQPNYTRQKTRGAAALELIIKRTLSENIDGIISSSAIAEAEDLFGTYRADGSRSVPARYDFASNQTA
jgi:hypothetical protein